MNLTAFIHSSTFAILLVTALAAQAQDSVYTAQPPIYCYTEVDIQPEFPGGMTELASYLQENLIYPFSARESFIEGETRIAFHILPDGSIGQAQVLQSLGTDFDGEVLRTLQLMPNWTPGMVASEAVTVRMVIPIRFELTL